MIGKPPALKLWFVMVLSMVPFLWVLTLGRGTMVASLASLAGLIGVVLLLWQFVLGGQYITSLFPLETSKILQYHMFLGVYGTLFVLLHPLLEMLALSQKWSFLVLSDFSSSYEIYLALGRLAIFLFLVVWITSALYRLKLGFRLWKKIHYLSYPLLFFALLHATKIGIFVNRPGLLHYYWLGLWGVFLFILASRVIYFKDKVNVASQIKKSSAL